jgi:hypothetical protein
VLVETRRSFTPGEVDDMELWVIAELLGINEPAAAGAGSVTEAQWRAQAADLNAQRLAHAKAVAAAQAAGEEPPPPLPVPPSATPEVTTDMIEALRRRRAAKEAAQQGA